LEWYLDTLSLLYLQLSLSILAWNEKVIFSRFQPPRYFSSPQVLINFSEVRFMSGDNLKEEHVQAAVTHLKPLPEPPRELEKLFREHNDLIFRTAYRVTGSAEDAEDVLQTIFLRLAKRAEIDLAPSPASYLHRAAVNASLDVVRSRTTAKSVALDDLETDLTEKTSLNPESQHADRELRKLIQKAVARLGQSAAEMFVLRYFEGYGNSEIAEMLDTSQMVVAVTLHRSRARLRKEIGNYLEKHHEA
jgi:RNA polymerase sigma-70 factor (ECF subfamily)